MRPTTAAVLVRISGDTSTQACTVAIRNGRLAERRMQLLRLIHSTIVPSSLKPHHTTRHRPTAGTGNPFDGSHVESTRRHSGRDIRTPIPIGVTCVTPVPAEIPPPESIAVDAEFVDCRLRSSQ